MNIYKLLFLFLTYSFFGYFLEVLRVIIKYNKYINRGFLRGPWCPIYGIGMLIVYYICLNNNLIISFLYLAIIISILEYLTSFIMEKLFNLRWWDYSDRKLNINGRICLLNILLFSFFGIFFYHFLNPIILKLFNIKLKDIILFLSFLMFFDFIISIILISKIKIKNKKNKKDSTEEVNNILKRNI